MMRSDDGMQRNPDDPYYAGRWWRGGRNSPGPRAGGAIPRDGRTIPGSGPLQNPATATPATTTQALGQALVGWDQGNWDNQSMQTPKYQLGRIFSKYDPSKGFTDPMMEEIKKLFPNASASRDILTGLGDWEGKPLGDIDAIASFGGSSPSWAWQPKNEAAQSGGNPLGASGLGMGVQALTPNVSTSSNGMLQQALQALAMNRIWQSASNPMLR